mgnify:CR=1 FL=1
MKHHATIAAALAAAVLATLLPLAAAAQQAPAAPLTFSSRSLTPQGGAMYESVTIRGSETAKLVVVGR